VTLEQLLLEGDLDRIQSQLDSLCNSAEEIDEALKHEHFTYLRDEARHISNVARRVGRQLREYRERSRDHR
jgi:hypothetical protein